MTQIQSTGQNTISIGDALQLAREQKITLKESKSPFSLYQLSKNMDSQYFLVSFLAKACAGLISGIKVPTKSVTDREVIPLTSGQRDALYLDGFRKALVTDTKSIKQHNAQLVERLSKPKSDQEDYLKLAFADETLRQKMDCKMDDLPHSIQQGIRKDVDKVLKNLVNSANAKNTRLDQKTVLDEMKVVVRQELFLRQAFAEISASKGYAYPLSANDHNKLRQGIAQLHLMQKPMIKSDDWEKALRDPASPVVKERIQKEVLQLIEKRQKTLDHIGQMGLDERQKSLFTARVTNGEPFSSIEDLNKIQAKRSTLLTQLDSFLATKEIDEPLKAFTKEFVHNNLQVTSTAQIDRMLALREPALGLIQVLNNSSSSGSEVVSALHDLFNGHASVVKDMESEARAKGKEFGDDERVGLIGDVLDFARTQAGLSDGEARKLCDRLRGPEMTELRDALEFMQGQHASGIIEENRSLRTVFMLNILYSAYGQQIGKEQAEIEQELTTPRLINKTNVPEWTKPLAPKTQFLSRAFTQLWSEKLNQSVTSDLKAGKTEGPKSPFSSSGIHNAFVKDLHRLNFKLNGQSTAQVPDIERFFTDAKGTLNKNHAMAVTSLLYQEFFNQLQVTLLEHPDVRGSLALRNGSMHFDLSRLANGDYKVGFLWAGQPNGIVSRNGDMRMLDPRSSQFAVSGSCLIQPGKEPLLVFAAPPVCIREFVETNDPMVASGQA